MLEEIIAKVAKMDPLVIALLILLLLAFALYKATPKLLTRKTDHGDVRKLFYDEQGREVWARHGRVEEISARVHTLAGNISTLTTTGAVNADRIRTLEVRSEDSNKESGALKLQLERLSGQVEVGNTQVSNLSDRIDQNDEKLGARMDRLDETMSGGLKRVDETLTGLQRSFMERKN